MKEVWFFFNHKEGGKEGGGRGGRGKGDKILLIRTARRAGGREGGKEGRGEMGRRMF